MGKVYFKSFEELDISRIIVKNLPGVCTFTMFIFSAVFTTLRSVIMANLLGLEKLNSSFGIIVLCEGIASFIGAPLAGRY